ncbi:MULTISPECIES: hypothetical protein [Haloferax]|uniref:DUF8073 domain-containing protein n=6 Tax=Haloferax TaxID=2251 RepID=D4GS79_HALVD|nr:MULTISPECIES: hypothetical protein [Haloferax]ADE03551.1 uncharacterized protein HVO_1754 [Haloferax volcanii DS2]ELY35266.1 hypothetical protein C498_04096 [Haloferax volcanii DS2]ELZ57094.1 hypothetical protein C460_12871 [Haloferax sp. ATCC BAA-646]ELZ68462.1 hypothetical protein C459_00075 [Haloferax sp. ATCC BAA-645]ELZ68793.1 hypothetical protein C458_08002 [Haloferax sp. ATCC BAA-644]
MHARSWATVLFALVIGLLLALGVVRLAAGDTGDFARNAGIAALLTVFAVALVRDWETNAD